jgi:glycosyltransferase involved in cell wall biosynthesis
MNILIISQYFLPDITAAAYRVSETAKILQERGHHVVVITSTPHKGGDDPIDNSIFSSDDIIRVKVDSLSNNAFWSYVEQYTGFALRALWCSLGLFRRFKYDVVWVTSPPLFIAITSIIIQALTKRPTVLDIRDIWPNSAVEIGKIKSGSIIEKIGKLLEVAAYKKSKALTCVSKPMKKYISEYTEKKISVVYNGVMKERTTRTNSYASCLKNRIIYCYAGNLGYAQGLDYVISSFALAKQNKGMELAELYIIGTGALEKDLKKQVHLLNISSSVTFFGVKPKNEALEIMSNADVLLIPLIKSNAFKITVPSKVFDYMSLGKPIIGCIDGEGVDILSESGGNILIPPDDVESLSEAFVRMKKEINIRYEKARDNIRIVNEKYSRESSVDVLEEILYSVVK